MVPAQVTSPEHPADCQYDFIPGSILLQWHITERCNTRCAHCYQDSSETAELDLPQLGGILNQFLALLDDCDLHRVQRATPGHVTVTGGEPFVREDFLDLLDLLTA